MDRLINLMGGLNIDEESIQIDELVDKLKNFDIAATKYSTNQEYNNDDDVMTYDESLDESLDDLCNRFESIKLDKDGVYIKHVTGMVMFIPYGQCGLMHKISFGMNIPRWTVGY